MHFCCLIIILEWMDLIIFCAATVHICQFLYHRQSGSSVVANPVEPSSATSHYNCATLAGTPSQTSAAHGIDALYPAADVYGHLAAASIAPHTLCTYSHLCLGDFHVMSTPKILGQSIVCVFAEMVNFCDTLTY